MFAGALSFEDGLRSCRPAGEAMQAAADATPGGMVSVLGLDVAGGRGAGRPRPGRPGRSESPTTSAPATRSSPATLPAIDEVEQLADAKGGIRTVRLAVAGAFHTDLMKPADEQAGRGAGRASTLQPPRVPVWSNVDAKPHTDPAEIRDLLVRQVLSPVRWEETMRGLLAAGVERFYEIGPGRVLAGLLKRVNRKADIRNVTA